MSDKPELPDESGWIGTLSQFEVITFDCYGTLIDWETGIRNAFEKALAKTGQSRSLANRAVDVYSEEEAKIESASPHALYRTILSKTAVAVAQRIGWDLKDDDSHFLSESLPSWKPFIDTNPALERLVKNHILGILSNTDNDLLAGTLKHLHSKFDIVVTAEKIRSYKPSPGHFEEARRIIGHRTWLHSAASWFHDVEPARRLGINTAWINRKSARPSSNNHDFLVVKDLAELADKLQC